MPAYSGAYAYPTPLTRIGLGAESGAARGTAVAPSAWLPVKTPKYKPNQMLIPDQTLQGSMVQTYDLVSGIRYDGHGWDAPPYMDTFPLMVLGEFGFEKPYTPATLTATTVATTAGTAGGTTFTVASAANLHVGDYVVLGQSAVAPTTLETVKIATITGANITTTFPLIYNHPIGDAVQPLAQHKYSLLNNQTLGTQTYTPISVTGATLTLTTAQATSLAVGMIATGAGITNTYTGNVTISNINVGTGVVTLVAATGATLGTLTVSAYTFVDPNQGAQPPSFTITDFDGEEWRQVTQAQLDELMLKGNGTGLVDYTCTWMGNPAIAQSISSSGTLAGYPFTPTNTTVQTVAPWTFYCSIGGTYNPTVTDWEVTWKRNVKPIPALTGQQQYFTYFANVLTASGKLTFVEQVKSPQLNAFLSGTRQAFDFTLFDQLAGSAMNIHASTGQYKTGEIDRSKEYVEVVVEFEMLPSATDSLSGAGGVSPCTVTVANSVNTAYVNA